MRLNLYLLLPEILFLSSISILIVKDYIIDSCKMKCDYMLSMLNYVFLSLIFLYFLELFFYSTNNYHLITCNNFYLTEFSIIIKLLCSFLAWSLLLIKKTKQKPHLHTGLSKRYLIVFCFSFFSLLLFIMSYNFITLILTIELLGLSCVVLITEVELNDQSTTILNKGPSLSYYLMHVTGSIMLLMGVLAIYTVCGTLNLGELSLLISEEYQDYQIPFLLNVGLLFLFSGLFIKMGLSPYYSWILRSYRNLNMFNLAYFLVILKIAYFSVIYQLLFFIPELSMHFNNLFLFIALLNIFVGPLVTIQQTTLKKLLIGSSITNAGYLVIGVCFDLQSFENTYFLSFIIAYSLAMLGFFLIEGIASLVFSIQGATTLADFQRLPSLLKMQFVFILFCLMGFPPTFNFFVKIKLLLFLFYYGPFFSYTIFIFSILAMFYYLSFIINFISVDTCANTQPTKAANKDSTLYLYEYSLLFLITFLAINAFPLFISFLPLVT